MRFPCLYSPWLSSQHLEAQQCFVYPMLYRGFQDPTHQCPATLGEKGHIVEFVSAKTRARNKPYRRLGRLGSLIQRAIVGSSLPVGGDWVHLSGYGGSGHGCCVVGRGDSCSLKTSLDEVGTECVRLGPSITMPQAVLDCAGSQGMLVGDQESTLASQTGIRCSLPTHERMTRLCWNTRSILKRSMITVVIARIRNQKPEIRKHKQAAMISVSHRISKSHPFCILRAGRGLDSKLLVPLSNYLPYSYPEARPWQSELLLDFFETLIFVPVRLRRLSRISHKRYPTALRRKQCVPRLPDCSLIRFSFFA